jgi:hypothetical protein
MSQFILADTTINVINAAEAQIAGLKADNKANNQAANDQKIGAYCELIASLAPVKLVKGNLPRAVSKALRVALLEEAGLKEATAKRYVENSVGAIRMFELSGMDNATPEMVREFFDDSGIDSENKLAKAIKGEAEKSQGPDAGGTGGRQVVERQGRQRQGRAGQRVQRRPVRRRP